MPPCNFVNLPSMAMLRNVICMQICSISITSRGKSLIMEQIQFRRQKNEGKQFRQGSKQLVLFQTEIEKTKLFEIGKKRVKSQKPA